MGNRYRAAAPATDDMRAAQLLQHGVTESFALNDDPTQPARIYGHADAGGIGGGILWPVLAALVAGLASLWAFARRESTRSAQPPPRHVRDAVALVGETLAATHNPRGAPAGDPAGGSSRRRRPADGSRATATSSSAVVTPTPEPRAR